MYSFLLLSITIASVGKSLAIDCTGIKAISPRCKTNESAYARDVFFVGGQYVPSDDQSQSILSDQIYIERLTPASGVRKKYPLIFTSAGIPSGTVWLNTPDNRKGWASYFVDEGYQVYILDITVNGRSGQNDLAKHPLRAGSTDYIHENGFTAPENLDPYPQSQGHNQWPGEGIHGDPIFDAFFAQTVPLTANTEALELSMRTDGCKLLSLTGQAYVTSHSAGGTYATLMSDECPELIRASINLEPGNIPFQSFIGNSTVSTVGRTAARPYGLTVTPIIHDPPVSDVTTDLHTVEVGVDTPALRSCILQATSSTVRTLPQIAKVPHIIFTAANSPHITYDHCFISYLHQTGVEDVTWIKFGDLGIYGNGHFFFIEKNNLVLAEVVAAEIAKRN